MITLNTSHLKAVLFDFDGTLVDTEPLHHKSYHQTLLNYGVEYVTLEEHLNQYISKGSQYIFEKEKEKHGLQEEVPVLMEKKRALYVELANNGGLDPTPGIIELVNKLTKKGLKLAIVSGSSSRSVMAALKGAKIPEVFDLIITRDDFTSLKPDPECYFKALEKLHLKAAEVIVFEDALIGVQAGINAGLETIALARYFHPSEYKKLGKKIRIIKDFTEVKVT